jgi:hypothetical protein
MIPDSTITVGGFAALLTLLYKAYTLGKSHGKLRQELNGVANREKDKREKLEERVNRMEKSLLLVSKNDPEGRRIVAFLDNRPEDKVPE